MSKERKFSQRAFNATALGFLAAFCAPQSDRVGGIKLGKVEGYPDTSQEVSVISSLVEKNTILFETLAPNGIAIHKDPNTTPQWGILRAFSYQGEITIFTGANFQPNAPIEGPENQVYKTQEKYLEWILYHELGHLFLEKVHFGGIPRDFIYFMRRRKPIFVWDIHENSIEETFADYFATYFTNPSLLSEHEKRYFSQIEKTITGEHFPLII